MSAACGRSQTVTLNFENFDIKFSSILKLSKCWKSDLNPAPLGQCQGTWDVSTAARQQ